MPKNTNIAHLSEDALPDKFRDSKKPLIVREKKRGLDLRLKEIWEYRELSVFFLWRDIKVRYKQTILGVAWAVLQPFLTMIVFSIFFGKLAKVPSDNLPYPIFSYAALVPWQLFSSSVSLSSNSLINNTNLITKVYFPRVLLPFASVLSCLVDFAIAFVVLIGMMIYYDIYPTIWIITLPVFTVLAILASLAISLWLSPLNVKYRDVKYVIPFFVQFWLFITPIAYPSSLVPEQWRLLYSLNPMTGVVQGFRWALLGNPIEADIYIFISIAVTIILFISGLYYFRNVENSFADVI